MNYTDSVPFDLREKEREDFDFWASARVKTKTFLIGKRLKTNDLWKTAPPGSVVKMRLPGSISRATALNSPFPTASQRTDPAAAAKVERERTRSRY